MAADMSAVSDPVFVSVPVYVPASPPAFDPAFVSILEECLRVRSRGSMIASLRDVWHMARWHGYEGSYQDAFDLLGTTGRYRLTSGIDEPVMIRPLPRIP